MTLPPALDNVKFCVAKVVFMTGAFKVALIFALPTTCNAWPGIAVKMPTLPPTATNVSAVLVSTSNVPEGVVCR